MSESEALAGALVAVARALDHVASAIEASQWAGTPANVTTVMSSGPPAGGAGPPSAPAGNGGAKSPLEIWMPKAIFKVCKEQNWDIADVGFRVLGRKVDPDSREWPVADLKQVLAAFKKWGV